MCPRKICYATKDSCCFWADPGLRASHIFHSEITVLAETGERLAPIVQEDGVMHSAVSHRPFDHGCSCWPEWTKPSLVSFPNQSNRWSISEREIRYDEVSGFVNASPGVVEKEQQGMVA